MPTCTSESLTRVWPSSESIHAGSIASSPTSSSPSTSPDSTLRRHRFRRSSSAATIHEPFVIQSDHRDSRSQSPTLLPLPDDPDSFSYLQALIGWYPTLLLRLIKALLVALLPRSNWRQLLFALPMLWLSIWLWCISQIVNLPFTVIKMSLSLVLSKSDNRKKRTVLISGGSTLQALHLARNFYSAGARVVTCEIDNLFAITRFSTAVSRFYTLPRPSVDQAGYVRALCSIVDKEGALYYIPVSSTTPAYYDALAKPHLELLNCTCFCPGVKEVWALDDTLEVLKRCQKSNIPTPMFQAVTSKIDVERLYEVGIARTGRFVMTTVGMSGLRERQKLVLPPTRRDLKLGEISMQKPWVVVGETEGAVFLTCTTVKQSQVIANVTCQLDSVTTNLIPVEHREIDEWLRNFFTKLSWLRPITGHVSFRFVVRDGAVVVVSSRVGVSLPYICYTSVHPRLVWKPCRHFLRQNSGPLVVGGGSGERYWVGEAVTRMVGREIDRREALFALWDPLPYCAYYHVLLPFRNMLGFVQRRQDQFPRTMMTPIR